MSDSSGYQAGGPMLQLALAGLGHSVGLATVNGDLAWLRDAGLVALRQVGDVYIAELTAQGLYAAKGRTHVPGVARVVPGR
ncbi:MAG TPA: ArsR family transcriptional regulator [Thiobacillaceae bacterium]|nr:ArsR family transcriptional regulator [Thiobacillaceae bacterium]